MKRLLLPLLLLGACAPSLSVQPLPMSPLKRTAQLTPESAGQALGVYHEYSGKTINDKGYREVEATFWLTNSRVEGEYTIPGVFGSKGLISGEYKGGRVELLLTNSTQCRYLFKGTLSQTVLRGTGTPDYCEGGTSFEWELRRGGVINSVR